MNKYFKIPNFSMNPRIRALREKMLKRASSKKISPQLKLFMEKQARLKAQKQALLEAQKTTEIKKQALFETRQKQNRVFCAIFVFHQFLLLLQILHQATEQTVKNNVPELHRKSAGLYSAKACITKKPP